MNKKKIKHLEQDGCKIRKHIDELEPIYLLIPKKFVLFNSCNFLYWITNFNLFFILTIFIRLVSSLR